MTQRHRRQIQDQLVGLFDALTDRPQWTDFPAETRRTVTELVARMLKQQRHQEAENATQEVEHE